MGGFCAKSENDEIYPEHSRQLNNDLQSHHYSEKPEKKHLDSSLYQSVHLISNGNHKIERCERLKKIVVVKRVEKNIFQGTEQIEMQKQVLINVRFPFICKLIQFRDTPQECVFELECCVWDLRTYMRKQHLTDVQLQFIVAQIALAIHQIHNGGYIYRALHPSHVLIAEDGYIRLIGFGHSSNKSSCPQIMTYEELCIFPPETIYGVFDQAGDWWSLGCLMYKILTDKYPFENPEQNFDQLREEKEQQQITFPKLFHPILENFMSQLLQADTKQRLVSLEKVKEHQYFLNFDWEKLKNKQIVSPLII